MKIILLISSLGAGGTERVAAGLCNAWAARGDDVTMIATFSGGGEPFYDVSRGVELIYLADVVGVKRLSVASYLLRLRALRRLLQERQPDVIVSLLPNVNVTTLLASAFLKIPVIICERSDPTSYRLFFRLHVMCQLTYRFADMLTVQTEGVAHKLQGFYPGLKEVRAIPNALSAEVLQYRKTGGGDRKILLSLGRLAREKQIDRLLDAFAMLADAFSNWDLHIYGDGPNRQALEAAVREKGLHTRVFLKGATSDPWAAMAASDAFAQVSLYEGFPNALLEAMGIGLPCVAFNCPSGPAEIMRGGEAGLLVPLNDQEALVAALRRVMEDEALRRELGARAREEVQHRYSLPAVLAQWDDLFLEVGARTRARITTGASRSALTSKHSRPKA